MINRHDTIYLVLCLRFIDFLVFAMKEMCGKYKHNVGKAELNREERI